MKRKYFSRWIASRAHASWRPDFDAGRTHGVPGAAQPSATRFKRDGLPREARQLLDGWHEPRLALSILAAVFGAFSILLLVGLHMRLTGWAAAVLYPVVLVLVARQLRSAEVLVHEGSHYNFTRRRKLNDRVVNVVAAYPVFQDVARFRESHRLHHELLGHEHDPCRIRFFELKWNELDRTSARRYAAAMARKLWAYSASWWRLIGSNLPVLGAGTLWHLLVFVLPLGLLAGTGEAGGSGLLELLLRGAAAWLAYVGVAFVVVLPPMRFIAEAAKHDYEAGTTTLTGTISNIGAVHWLLHPHGDGLHLLHHLDPNIPHHRLRLVHEWMMRNDPEYASGRQRHHVLEVASMVEETSGEVDG